ncbi:hypothetical protein [Flavobacterium beibuense]|uniref:Transposase n=1 Tax=Flavobacterium beibuense TaxID=657326 RepID=A0A444WGA5_9FLAO|nr:hypothetical protein [Flavobacterium beibuense]RYJ44883.1 hypothetical protein NU09_0517 [Flavobacterium beibuense]
MKRDLNILSKAATTSNSSKLALIKRFMLFLKNITGYETLFNKNIHKSLEIMYANLRV